LAPIYIEMLTIDTIALVSTAVGNPATGLDSAFELFKGQRAS